MRLLAKAIAISALLSAPAMAGDPAALILDASGTIDPEIDLYEEIADGTVLKLGSDAVLTISHYSSCEEVVLAGGMVTVGADELAIDGSEVRSRTAVQCPDHIVMAAADLINMAVTLRSARKARVMAPEPEFVLAGPWGRQFDKLDVYGKEGQVATVPVAGGQVSWPSDLPPLAAGEIYVVVLNGPGARQHAARIEVSDDPRRVTVLTGK